MINVSVDISASVIIKVTDSTGSEAVLVYFLSLQRSLWVMFKQLLLFLKVME